MEALAELRAAFVEVNIKEVGEEQGKKDDREWQYVMTFCPSINLMRKLTDREINSFVPLQS